MRRRRATFAPGVAVAYVATGVDFPDALSGSAAAGLRGGPVLLVSPSGVPAVVATELSRLKPAKIVILGGTRVVSAAVQSALAAYLGGTPPPPATSPLTWGAPTSIQPIPGPPTSISCPTASFCAAVDQSGHALTFNGATWSAPTHIDSGTSLTSGSCPSATFCAAVDFSGNAFTFNGTTWSAPSSIDPGQELWSVSCPSATFCAAVDRSGNALTFNGTGWSAPTSLNMGGYGATSVSCPSASFCVAAAEGRAVTFNGTTWSTPTSIIPGSTVVPSVSCPSASFCVAIDGRNNAIIGRAS